MKRIAFYLSLVLVVLVLPIMPGVAAVLLSCRNMCAV